MKAGIVVFEAHRVARRLPTVEHDLPASAPRLKLTAVHIAATVVNGHVMLTDNRHTGVTPGQLYRAKLILEQESDR